jgi:hypothetical protein
VPFFALALALLALATPAQIEYVIVHEGAKDYHRPGCPAIKDAKDIVVMTRGQADGKGLKPHADCDPSNPRNATSSPKAPPVYVFTDGSPYYHREKCAKLKKDARRVTVEVAAQKHWPCPTCKPPIRPRKPR